MSRELRISYSEYNEEQVSLVGLKLKAETTTADLYTLILDFEVARDDQSRPLTEDGQIVFFRNPRRANDMLRRGDPAFRKYIPFTGDIHRIHDLPRAVAMIRSEPVETDRVLFSLLNDLLEALRAVAVKPSKGSAFRLEELADHLTFHPELTPFFDENRPGRARYADSLLSCIGAVLLSSKVVD